MTEQAQQAVVEFLANGAGSGCEATLIETHISRVFLLPERVLRYGCETIPSITR